MNLRRMAQLLWVFPWRLGFPAIDLVIVVVVRADIAVNPRGAMERKPHKGN